jgi:hypothetical protein
MKLKYTVFIAGAAVLVVVGAVAASAQTLGDVARKEAERRKTVKSSGKVYTNDSLRSEPQPAAPAQAAPPAQAGAAQAPPSQSGVQPGGAQPGQTPPAQPDETKTEAYWKQRMTAERDGLARAQTFAEALQSRINALTTDFAARSDPAQRDVIGADRQKALAELDRVKKEIEQHTKGIADIQEEARKAGVPAGWVR